MTFYLNRISPNLIPLLFIQYSLYSECSNYITTGLGVCQLWRSSYITRHFGRKYMKKPNPRQIRKTNLSQIKQKPRNKSSAIDRKHG